MNVLMISFDPTTSGASKASLEAVIKSQPKWARALPNTFVVVTTMKANEMRDSLMNAASVPTIVYTVTNGLWGTNKISKDVTDWLNNNWLQ